MKKQAIPAEGDGIPTVSILGSRVDRVDMRNSTAKLVEMLADGGKHHIVVLPVNSILAARKCMTFKEILQGASLVVPDGVPLLWASRLLGRPIPGRVAGSDFMWEMSKIAAQQGYTCYFLGGKTDVPDKLVRNLSKRFPGLPVVGMYTPPHLRRFPKAVNRDIINRINGVRPDILWVGMGAPKQELWIHQNIATLDIKAAIGVGAAFDILSATIRRAPRWMQRMGLEWFHRFLMEPRRMFRRYFVDAMPFFPLVILQWMTRGWSKC